MWTLWRQRGSEDRVVVVSNIRYNVEETSKSSLISSAYDKNWDSTIIRERRIVRHLGFKPQSVQRKITGGRPKQDNTHLQPNKRHKLRTDRQTTYTNSCGDRADWRNKILRLCCVWDTWETRSECLSSVLTSLSTPLTRPSDWCNEKLSLQICITHNYTLVNRAANPNYRILQVSLSTQQNVPAYQQVPNSD
jgi:hypothetical protein